MPNNETAPYTKKEAINVAAYLGLLSDDVPLTVDSPKGKGSLAATLRHYADILERVEKYRKALREIARGKMPQDMGDGFICAARLSGIARAALTEQEQETR